MSTAQQYLERVRLARDDGRLNDALLLASAGMFAADAEPDREVGCNIRASIARIYMSGEVFEEAARWWRDRLDYAKAHGMVEQIAGGFHDLALAYEDMGLHSEAVKNFGLALEMYPSRHRRLSALIADMARYEVDRGTSSGPCYAVQAWKAFHHDAETPRDRLFALANVAEAGAACSMHTFDRAWPLLMAEVRQVSDGEGLARVLVSAATAAEKRRRYEDAEELLEAAVAVADRRGEILVRERAETYLASARSTV